MYGGQSSKGFLVDHHLLSSKQRIYNKITIPVFTQISIRNCLVQVNFYILFDTRYFISVGRISSDGGRIISPNN